jgi:hypothetical protein
MKIQTNGVMQLPRKRESQSDKQKQLLWMTFCVQEKEQKNTSKYIEKACEYSTNFGRWRGYWRTTHSVMSVIDWFQDQSSETFNTIEHIHAYIHIAWRRGWKSEGGENKIRIKKQTSQKKKKKERKTQRTEE